MHPLSAPNFPIFSLIQLITDDCDKLRHIESGWPSFCTFLQLNLRRKRKLREGCKVEMMSNICLAICATFVLACVSLKSNSQEVGPYEYFKKFKTESLSTLSLSMVPKVLQNNNAFIQVRSHSDAQETLDSIVGKILILPAGKVLCRAANYDPIIAARLFAMTFNSEICRQAQEASDTSFERQYAYVYQGEFSKEIFPRNILIALDSEGSSPVSSWTTPPMVAAGTTTILYIQPGTDWATISKMLVHEFAISLDTKYSLFATSIGALERTWQDGGFHPFDVNFNDEELKRFFNSIMDTQWDLLFATRRALEIEKLLDPKLPIVKDLSNWRTCPNDIGTMYYSYFEPMLLAFGSGVEFSIDSLLNPRSAMYVPSPLDFQNLDRILWSSKNKVLWDKKEISLCAFLSTPLLGLGRHSFISKGPRPAKFGW